MNGRALKIAQVAPLQHAVPPRADGGTERMVADLSDALTAAGHDVTVFAAEGSVVAGTLRVQGAAASDRDDAPPGYKAAAECVMLEDVAASANAFDIIHCHTEFAHALALRACREKTLTTLHWRTDEADRQAFFAGIPGLRLAAISESQASHCPEHALEGVVPHGIAADRYTPGPGGRGAVFLGRMTDQKGPDRAISAARRAGMPIALAGDIDIGNPSYFADHVEPLLGEDARHIGPVGDAQKQDLLGQADALLFPIDWPEPFGLVMIEAMACGTPVVAWRRGSVPEVVEDGVTGFVVDSEEEAADALRRAHALDRKAVRAAFDARHTATRMAADYAAIYARMIAGQASEAAA